MRIKDFLPEDWWKDLDPGVISMMGYGVQDAEEPQPDLVSSISTDVKNIRGRG
jgi:hypothetical protein